MAGFPFDGRLESRALAREHRPASKISRDLQPLVDLNPGSAVSIIIQTSSAPARSLLSSLDNLNGVIHRSYANLNSIAVQLPAAAVTALSRRHDVSFISLDRTARAAGHIEVTSGASQARSYSLSSSSPINGSGVGIAVIDSGIDPSHASFRAGNSASRIIANIDFTGEARTDDPHGHGTHVASLAAGSTQLANGAYAGIAPAANLINVRVLDSTGRGSMSSVIAGIDWCISNRLAYNIRVLNLSLGTAPVDSYINDPVCQAVRRAVDAGLVVTVAAGNHGKDSEGNKLYGAIHSPGIEPSAITAGAANSFGTDSRSDDAVATYSSRGPTRSFYTDGSGARRYDNLIKPDLIAPGNRLIAAKAPNNLLVTNNPALDASTSSDPARGMMYMSGTSMAAPIVAGAAALLLQRNPALTPNLVKALLQYTAQPVAGFSTVEQGAGLLNIEGAVRLAGLVRRDLSGRSNGDALLSSASPAQISTIAGG
ncbi:MAG TPA: S8 family peptidase, partial [Blastocatellia bacterium]|nr:S8 family peptidase [Blastocatellia bacterium]